MAARKDVNVRQCRAHASRERLEGRILFVGVEPHDTMREAREPRHLLSKDLRIVHLQSIRADNHRRPSSKAAVSMHIEEALEGLANACAAVPIEHLACGSRKCLVWNALGQGAGNAGQARRKAKGFPAPLGAHSGVREEQKRPGVRRHRAGNIEQEDDPAGIVAPSPPRSVQWLTCSAE